MSLVHVAVAVIVNEDNQVLIALRQSHQHQGDLWEFPGGKVEAGEATEVALVREIKEELGIEVIDPVPLIEIKHEYSDKSVLLDVWSTRHFNGQPKGLEGQMIRWCPIGSLADFNFPAANQTIIEVIQSTEL
jgi:8-oxo-dGTP diphosphatase